MGNFRAEDYPRKFGKNCFVLKFFWNFFLKNYNYNIPICLQFVILIHVHHL